MFESSLLVRVPGSALPCEETNMTYKVPCSDIVGLFISSVWGRVGETRGHGVALALAHQGKLVVYVEAIGFPPESPCPVLGPSWAPLLFPLVTGAFLDPRQPAQASSLLASC